jgi:hypothetical protein
VIPAEEAAEIAAQISLRPDPRPEAQRLAEGVRMAVTDLPGQPSLAERRKWAAHQAVRDGHATIRPGEGERFGHRVITPENADEVERWWADRQEAALLRRAYTDDQLLQLGIHFGADDDGPV